MLHHSLVQFRIAIQIGYGCVFVVAGFFLSGSECDRCPEHRTLQAACAADTRPGFHRNIEVTCDRKGVAERVRFANTPQRPSRAPQDPFHPGICNGDDFGESS